MFISCTFSSICNSSQLHKLNMVPQIWFHSLLPPTPNYSIICLQHEQNPKKNDMSIICMVKKEAVTSHIPHHWRWEPRHGQGFRLSSIFCTIHLEFPEIEPLSLLSISCSHSYYLLFQLHLLLPFELDKILSFTTDSQK